MSGIPTGGASDQMLGGVLVRELYELRGRGRSIDGIARELGISRNTVRRYLRSPEVPKPRPRAKRGSQLGPIHRVHRHKAFGGIGQLRGAAEGDQAVAVVEPVHRDCTLNLNSWSRSGATRFTTSSAYLIVCGTGQCVSTQKGPTTTDSRIGKNLPPCQCPRVVLTMHRVCARRVRIGQCSGRK